MSSRERGIVSSEKIDSSVLSQKISDGVKASIAQKTSEELAAARRKGWDRRGRICTVVIPALQSGKTVEEILEENPHFTKSQVTHVRKKARADGILPRPTKEELHEVISRAARGRPCPARSYARTEEMRIASSRAQKGKPCPARRTGVHRRSLEKVVQLAEDKKGRVLTEEEKDYFKVLVRARLTPRFLGKLNIFDLFEKYQHPLPHAFRQMRFLEMYLAACYWEGTIAREGFGCFQDGEKPTVLFQDMRKLYKSYAKLCEMFKATLLIQEMVAKEERIMLLTLADQILSSSSDPLFGLRTRNGLSAEDLDFLRIFRAVRECAVLKEQENGRNGHERPQITAAELDALYEKIDPGIFERLAPEIAHIREHTRNKTSQNRQMTVRRNGSNGVSYLRAEGFYKQEGLSWPES